ncbi:MAG: hypothetical protein KBT72_09800 [Zhongshania sp.]|jgi:hypothetical protein|nr:hypothetical protein [Zhongshania sp.]
MQALKLDELLVGLHECGIEKDLLASLFEGVKPATKAVVPLVIRAISLQGKRDSNAIHSETSKPIFEVPKYLNLGTPYRMGWRPHPRAVDLLIKHLEVNRADIAWLVTDFIQANEGIKKPNWSRHFISYALIAHRTKEFKEAFAKAESVMAAAEAPSNEHEVETLTDFSRAEIKENLSRLDAAVMDALKGKSVGLIFNHNLNARWQPPEWIVQELLKLHIKGRLMSRAFIFNPMILRAFIGHCRQHGPIFQSYEHAYYFWVRERFFGLYKLRVMDAQRIARETKAREVYTALIQ